MPTTFVTNTNQTNECKEDMLGKKQKHMQKTSSLTMSNSYKRKDFAVMHENKQHY